MPLGNTKNRYGSVSRTIHWLAAAVIISAIPAGLLANRLPYATDAEIARTFHLFSLHKTLGIAALAIGLVRIVWWVLQARPAPLYPERRLETFLALAVHWLLSIGLITVPIAGWLTHAATPGLAPIWWPFGQSLPLVPADAAVSEVFAAVHRTASKLLVASLVLHLAGVAKHAVLDRDSTLARMATGAEAGPGADTDHRLPAVAALALWSIVIMIGAVLGVLNAPDTKAPPPMWTVEAAEATLLDASGQPLASATNFGVVLTLATDSSRPDKGTLDISLPLDAMDGVDIDKALALIPFPFLQFYGAVTGDPPDLRAEGALDAGGITENGALAVEVAGDSAKVSGDLVVPAAPELTLRIAASAKRP